MQELLIKQILENDDSIDRLSLKLIIIALGYISYSMWIKRKTLTAIKSIKNVESKIDKIEKRLDNNIQGLLFDVLRNTTSLDLKLDDPAEKGLLLYFNDAINNISDIYHRAKKEGIHILKDPITKVSLLSHTEPSLKTSFSEITDGHISTYPEVFIQYVLDIQDRVWDSFIIQLFSNIDALNKDEEIWDIVKTHTANSFSNFAIRVVEKFNTSRHLVVKLVKKSDSSLISKDMIIDLITESFTEQAINMMLVLYKDKEYILYMVNVIKSNFTKYERDCVINMKTDSDTLTKINSGLLYILNKY